MEPFSIRFFFSHPLLEEDETQREVNRMNLRLKRAYFQEKIEEAKGDLKTTWEVLGEVLRGKGGRKSGVACGHFEKDGVGLTDRDEIAGGVL